MNEQDFERREKARLDAMYDAQFADEPTSNVDYADEPQVFVKSRNRWIASIMVDKKRLHLGSFVNQADAVTAYAAAKEKFHAIG